MKQCSKCKETLTIDNFYKDVRHSDELFSECKKCKNKTHKETKRTKLGVLRNMYNNQKRNTRGHGAPLYSKDEFIEYGLQDDDFNKCYNEWVDCNYDIKKIPTTDRLDTLGKYEIGNIRFISYYENYYRQSYERKTGIDNRVNKAIYKLDRKTDKIIDEYFSISDAAIKNKLDRANISKICNNSLSKEFKYKYQTCGGYKWKFKD